MEAVATPPKSFRSLGPTAPTERITILDSLRGIAILGILLMNMPSFGYPSWDPFLMNESAINFNTWRFISLVPDGTQRALFSMLFGAGIILFIRNSEKKSEGMRPADYFFRRQLWLLVFSLIDVFVLLWFGDILLDYALYGMLLFTFRNLPAKGLLICAGVCLLLMLARENRDLYQEKNKIVKGEAAAAMDTTVTKLTAAQKEDLQYMIAFKEKSSVEKRREHVESDIRKIASSNYADLYETQSQRYISVLVRYLYFELWDVLLFMFLGMAFFKMGILTGNAPAKIYWWMLIVGLGAGIYLSYLFWQPYIQYQFNRFEYVKHVSINYYQLQRALRSIGIFGGIMLLYRSGVFNWFFQILKPVGRMAFTNYLSQSLICALIFTSLGFAMYGRLERHELYYVVAAIWIFQVVFSNVWLKYFRFGPLEWAWRSLTYWQMQPMIKK